MPDSRYQRFPRERSSQAPAHEIAEGALCRKVDASGYFGFEGVRYRIGVGLHGEHVVIEEASLGLGST